MSDVELGSKHSRLVECGNRQSIQPRPDYSSRIVSPSRISQMMCNRVHLPQADLQQGSTASYLDLFHLL